MYIVYMYMYSKVHVPMYMYMYVHVHGTKLLHTCTCSHVHVYTVHVLIVVVITQSIIKLWVYNLHNYMYMVVLFLDTKFQWLVQDDRMLAIGCTCTIYVNKSTVITISLLRYTYCSVIMKLLSNYCTGMVTFYWLILYTVSTL